MRTFAVVITILILAILAVLVRMEDNLGSKTSANSRSATHSFWKKNRVPPAPPA